MVVIHHNGRPRIDNLGEFAIDVMACIGWVEFGHQVIRVDLANITVALKYANFVTNPGIHLLCRRDLSIEECDPARICQSRYQVFLREDRLTC